MEMAPAAAFRCSSCPTLPVPLWTLLWLVAAATRPALALTEQYPTFSLLGQELHRQQGQGGKGCPEFLAAEWGGEQQAAAAGDCGEWLKEGRKKSTGQPLAGVGLRGFAPRTQEDGCVQDKEAP